jgi:drug/metabolite transporter (DMT)-like permease
MVKTDAMLEPPAEAGLRPQSGQGIGRLLVPLAFGVLYGSGFVGAKYGLPDCPPLTMLALRFALAAALTALLAVGVRAPWPNTLREAAHLMAAGLLTVGMFSAGVFESINCGISPALSALIIALQPLLIAVLARRVVRERVSARQWVGLVTGAEGEAVLAKAGFGSPPPAAGR